MGERGSSQHPCQCGLLGRTEPLRSDWSAASILLSDWLSLHSPCGGSWTRFSLNFSQCHTGLPGPCQQPVRLTQPQQQGPTPLSPGTDFTTVREQIRRMDNQGLVINKNIFTRFKDKRVWNLILMLTFVINKFRHWLPLTDNCHQKKTFKKLSTFDSPSNGSLDFCLDQNACEAIVSPPKLRAPTHSDNSHNTEEVWVSRVWSQRGSGPPAEWVSPCNPGLHG